MSIVHFKIFIPPPSILTGGLRRKITVGRRDKNTILRILRVPGGCVLYTRALAGARVRAHQRQRGLPTQTHPPQGVKILKIVFRSRRTHAVFHLNPPLKIEGEMGEDLNPSGSATFVNHPFIDIVVADRGRSDETRESECPSFSRVRRTQ